MTDTHDHDRNGCALHGTLRLLDSIGSVVPILHASAGCSIGAWASEDSLGISLGGKGYRHRETSATLLQEKQVVFGGTSRLREQIKNTVKVVDGEVYAVVTGCVPEVIGDDVLAMVKEAREQEFPVVSLSSPGFLGNAWRGYANACRNLLLQLTDAGVRSQQDQRLVSLLGIAPGLDVSWDGDLLEIEAILARVGVRSLRLVGYGQSPKHWSRAAESAASVALSPWAEPGARALQERFSSPVVELGWLPVGSRDAGLLLARLQPILGLSPELVAQAREVLDDELRYFISKASSVLLTGDIQKRVAIVAGTASAVGIARFLAGTLGQLCEEVIISDDPDESHRTAIVQAVHECAPAAHVTFLSQLFEIERLLSKAEPEIILGSSLEVGIAERLSVPHLEISGPLGKHAFLQRAYAGVRGAVALTEDYISAFANSSYQRSLKRKDDIKTHTKEARL